MRFAYKVCQVISISIFILLFLVRPGFADDLTSTSFIVRDPIVGGGGGFGSSGSFNLYSTTNPTLSGEGSSASFVDHLGFRYYPYIQSGTLTATPNGAQVDLTWTASVAGLGYSVAGYKTGIASVSGGPYTYTAVGNVLSYSYTSLTPGQYCFVIQTLDPSNNVLATSNESCATVSAVLTLAISDGTVQFGTLSVSGPRYATNAGGSNSNSVAHTITTSSNASTGYTLSYKGATLSNGGNTVSPATIAGSNTGSAGSSQFAMSVSTSGSATIPTAYRQTSSNWSFTPNTTTAVASTAGVTGSETLSVRYLANISSGTPAGQYATNLTYVLTGNY